MNIKDLDNAYVGSTSVKDIYIGSTLVWTRTIAVLVNASDSSDIHEFDSCEEAATYIRNNTSINWELTINRGEVPAQCFLTMSRIVSLTLNEGVTSIGAAAFAGCEIEGSLVIPEGLTSIGESAFESCMYLTGTLTLPSTLTSISDSAFAGCVFTGSLTIPASVTNIGMGAFILCAGFDDDLTFLGTTEPTYGTNVFAYSSFTKCKVPSGYTKDTFCDLPVTY